MTKIRVLFGILTAVLVLALLVSGAFAQETTGGLQGVVKDRRARGFRIAQVVVTAPSLRRKKETETDSSGYYRFANLPPDTYTLVISGQGFSTANATVWSSKLATFPPWISSLMLARVQPWLK